MQCFYLVPLLQITRPSVSGVGVSYLVALYGACGRASHRSIAGNVLWGIGGGEARIGGVVAWSDGLGFGIENLGQGPR